MDETMHFDAGLLLEYQELLQTTRLIACYREFIRLFRWVRVELEKRMPEYKFQGSITENGMEFSYFQFTSPELKEKGLKAAVVFVHRNFQFQVWVSGFNRRYQAHYYDVWKDQPRPNRLHPARPAEGAGQSLGRRCPAGPNPSPRRKPAAIR